MKKTRFTEAKIVGILTELDGGTPATELARKHGIHANTIGLWRDKYAGMQTSDIVHMKQLEADNARMQRIIASQTVACAIVGQPYRSLFNKLRPLSAVATRFRASAAPANAGRLILRTTAWPIAGISAR